MQHSNTRRFNLLPLSLCADGAIANIIQKICHLPNRTRRYLTFSIDIAVFYIAIVVAFGLRLETFNPWPQMQSYTGSIGFILILQFTIFYSLGLYRPVIRHHNTGILGVALKALLLTNVLLLGSSELLHFPLLPLSVQLIAAFVTGSLVVLVRYTIRWLLIVPNQARRLQSALHDRALSDRGRLDRPLQQIIIYGAGSAGVKLAQALALEQRYQVVAFVDDNAGLHGRVVDRIAIHDPAELSTLVHRYQVSTILLAMPSVSTQAKRRVMQILKALPVQVKTVPTVADILSGRQPIGKVRQVDIADLLGREEVLPDPALLRINVTDKVVLVTGAGGSIGSELCRQIAQQSPRLIVLYELNEFALYSIDLELSEVCPEIDRVACLGSVTDASQLSAILNKHQVQTVYHAAAYKHVPMIEANPAQGIINNVQGTLVAAQAAQKAGVETFVLISTDKAVRPTNVMGTTKRVCELVLQALSAQARSSPSQFQTRFVMVRFGNVLDSNGSVVPRFRKQIAEGKPITVTHRDITRYFMSIPEASRLVIQAGAMGKAGEVFLLDMGEPVRIYDLAVQMIELSGLIPDEDIEIKVTGLRPGEKLYEELLIEANAEPTAHPKIYSAKEAMLPWPQLEGILDQLFLAAYQDHDATMRSLLQRLVPEFQPQLPARSAPSCPL